MLESKLKTFYVTYLHIVCYEHNIVGYEPLVSNIISNIRGYQADVY